MKYLMLIYGNEQVWNSVDADGFAKLVAEVDGFNAALRESGELVDSQGLVDRPRSVRVVGEAPVVTDGPYIEAKEYIGSFDVVDCETPERAAELAAMIPDARYTAVEVRPVMDSGGSEM